MNDATVRFGYDGAKLNAGLKDAEGRIKRTASKMEKSMSGIGGLMAGGGLLFAGKQAMDTVVNIDRLTRGMTTLEGSADGAKQRMDSLREASRLPGLDFEQAIQGDIRLRSVGISAELSREALIQMGNALSLAGGTASDLDGVVLALTQIVSKGKVSAEEINQIAERVPQVRAVMKDMFGTADTEVLQKMNIDAETFVATLVEGFGKLDRAQAGLDEKMNDFTASVKAATNAFAEGFVRDGVEGASQFGKALEDNLIAIREIGGAASSALGGAVDWLSKAAEATSFWTGQQAALYSLMVSEGPIDGIRLWKQQQNEILLNQQAVKDQTELLRQQTKVTEDLAKATAKASKLPNPAGLNEIEAAKSAKAKAEEATESASSKKKKPEKEKEESSNRLFSAQERLRKAQQDADREQMTNAQKIAALQSDIAAEEAAAAAFGTLDSKDGQAAQIEHKTKALELQKQIEDITKKDTEELSLQEQSKRGFREEIMLLEAKASGQDDVVKRAEKEMRIREKMKDIMDATGVKENEAREMAQGMVDLEDLSNKPQGGKKRKVRKERWMSGSASDVWALNNMRKDKLPDDLKPLSEREGMRQGRMMGGPSDPRGLSNRRPVPTNNKDLSNAANSNSGPSLAELMAKMNSTLERVFFAAS